MLFFEEGRGTASFLSKKFMMAGDFSIDFMKNFMMAGVLSIDFIDKRLFFAKQR